LSDAEIERAIAEDPDAAPKLDADFWAKAELTLPEALKERITMRIDRDVLDHFRSKGRGYQTRINAVLRSYIRYASKSAKPKRQHRAA